MFLSLDSIILDFAAEVAKREASTNLGNISGLDYSNPKSCAISKKPGFWPAMYHNPCANIAIRAGVVKNQKLEKNSETLAPGQFPIH
jgi:hypothetical protein